ncbi:hypothetical protein ETU08_10050 [Apibacter muscae]|uniref:Ig-like domain-containing protein n=1 Tax=Apibacter muscae TaxID=2509004 RepID=UPI0011ACF610|nr:Ig-like domain-containing domain [Apibacter muscae]TWP28047.1 hypothetical protein ETU08_10050 [Apibacter muscae]
MQRFVYIFCLTYLFTSCARMSMPEGGPKDINPPKFLGSNPKMFATNVDVNTKDLTLDFDEYMLVKDVDKQVVVSPPPQTSLVITPTSSAQKKLTVRFSEPLEKNTTYTINFGSSIQDNNEGNQLKNFSYIFSTGDYIDSLELSGKVQKSLNKDWDPSTVIGLYKVVKDSLGNDSINLKNKPYYITKIDSAGNFSLKNLHEGNYRLFAFTDLSSNLILDTKNEAAGFYPDIINPQLSSAYSITLSPIKQLYKAEKISQEAQGILKVNFKGNPKEVTIQPLDSNFPSYDIDHKPFSDSLYLYFNNKKFIDKEKKFKLEFLVESSNNKDTLSLVYDNSKESPLKLAQSHKEVTPTQSLTLESNNYIKTIDTNLIKVFKDSDTLDFLAVIDSTDTKKINLNFPVSYDSNYKIEINKNAIEDFLGHKNEDSIVYSLKTKKQNELGNLNIEIQNKPTSNFFFQLLDDKGKIIENIYGNNDSFNFKNLIPGTYSIRILVDENNNGFWDLLDLENLIPAEKTYLYPKAIEVRPYWDLNETWVL